jgi:hypothetical protein
MEIGTFWMSSATFRAVTVISPTVVGNAIVSSGTAGCSSAGSSCAKTRPPKAVKIMPKTRTPNKNLLTGFPMIDLPF